jgi:hypothetical protein
MAGMGWMGWRGFGPGVGLLQELVGVELKQGVELQVEGEVPITGMFGETV